MISQNFLYEAKRHLDKSLDDSTHINDIAYHAGSSVEFLTKYLISEVSPFLIFNQNTLGEPDFIKAVQDTSEVGVKRNWKSRDISELIKVWARYSNSFNESIAKKIILERNLSVHSGTVGMTKHELLINLTVFLRDSLPNKYTIDKDKISATKGQFGSDETIEKIGMVYSEAHRIIHDKVIKAKEISTKINVNLEGNGEVVEEKIDDFKIEFRNRHKDDSKSWYYFKCPSCRNKSLAIIFMAILEIRSISDKYNPSGNKDIIGIDQCGEDPEAECIFCKLKLSESDLRLIPDLKYIPDFVLTGGWYKDYKFSFRENDRLNMIERNIVY